MHKVKDVYKRQNYKHGMVGDAWVNYQREAYKYKNGDYPSDMSALFGNQDYTDAYNAGKWIDWIDEASGNTATTQKYSLSVSGGSEKTKIFASTSYNREMCIRDRQGIDPAKKVDWTDIKNNHDTLAKRKSLM